MSNYRGHTGYLLCVDWSPVDPDVVWTGGKDFTVQEWRVSKQEFTKPPKGDAQTRSSYTREHAPVVVVVNISTHILSGKKMVRLKEKTNKNRKNKKASGSGGAAPLEVNGEADTEGQKARVTEQEVSGEDEEDEVSSTNSSVPPGNGVRKRFS